jgi:hypothetical protein
VPSEVVKVAVVTIVLVQAIALVEKVSKIANL